MKLKQKELFPKTPTGIHGLDEITEGGFPKGIQDYDDPGVFMSFEELPKDLSQNVVSLGFDLDKLVANKKLKIDYVRVERSEIEETGEYDLEGLFIRLNHALRSTRARRIVLDTIESLFAGLSNAAVLRAELR